MCVSAGCYPENNVMCLGFTEKLKWNWSICEILLSTFKSPFGLILKQTHDYTTEGSSTLPPSTTTHPPCVIRLVARPSGDQHWTLTEAACQLNKQQFIGRGLNTLESLETISRASYWW